VWLSVSSVGIDCRAPPCDQRKRDNSWLKSIIFFFFYFFLGIFFSLSRINRPLVLPFFPSVLFPPLFPESASRAQTSQDFFFRFLRRLSSLVPPSYGGRPLLPPPLLRTSTLNEQHFFLRVSPSFFFCELEGLSLFFASFFPLRQCPAKHMSPPFFF